jgi:uncharacterized protein YciI
MRRSGDRVPLYLRILLLTGPRDRVEASVTGHLAQVSALRERGKLLGAGRLREGGGFVEVYEARDRREAEQIAAESPLVAAGLGAWILKELESFER